MVEGLGVHARAGVDLGDVDDEVADLDGERLGVELVLLARGPVGACGVGVKGLLGVVHAAGELTELLVGVVDGREERVLVRGGALSVLAGKSAHLAREPSHGGVCRRGCLDGEEISVPGVRDEQGRAAHDDDGQPCREQERPHAREPVMAHDGRGRVRGCGGNGALDASDAQLARGGGIRRALGDLRQPDLAVGARLGALGAHGRAAFGTALRPRSDQCTADGTPALLWDDDPLREPELTVAARALECAVRHRLTAVRAIQALGLRRLDRECT